MTKIIGVLLAGLILSGCSSSFLRDAGITTTTTVAAVAGTAACGPGCGVVAGAATGAGTAVVIPTKQQRALSDNPEIAKKQLEAEEKEAFLRLLEKWGIYAMILFALVFWLLPDPGKIFDRMRKKE